MTYPASSPSTYALQLKYGYTNGYLASITDVSDTPNVTAWTANAQNPAGQLTEETLGNGIVTSRAYDAVTMWLSSVQSGVGSGAGVKNLAFLYDEVGNVQQRQDNNLGLTENLYYDSDYRLTSTKLGTTQNLSITYDDTMGNITSRSDVASGATWTYSSTQKHAVTQAGSSSYTYAYDANGNMTTRQGQTIGWSNSNYPISISAGSGSTAESVALSYGPNRQRWEQVYTGNGATETTFYIGKPLELVQSGGVSDYRHYIYAGAEPVAVYSRKTSGVYTFSYLLSDHQGSVAAITNSSGAIDVSESFAPFGARRNPTTWSGAPSNSDLTTAAELTRQAYTFQTQLGLWMGMNHMNGRVEDAITGRMISADPFVQDASNAQSWNRYTYVFNGPVTYADPTGFVVQECISNPDPTVECVQNTPFPSYFVPVVPINWISLPNPISTSPGGTGGDGGSGRGGGVGAAPGSDIPPPRINFPPEPPVQQCHGGFLQKVAGLLDEVGQGGIDDGTVVMQAALAVYGSGRLIALAGGPAGMGIGGGAVAAAGVMTSVGGLTWGLGVVVKGGGAGLSWAIGNSQPLQSVAVQGAQGLLDDLVLPSGAPSPLDPISEGLEGTNPCP